MASGISRTLRKKTQGSRNPRILMTSPFVGDPPIPEKTREIERKPYVYYVYGKTGSGKSRWLYDTLNSECSDFDIVYYDRASRYWFGVDWRVPAKVCWYSVFDDSEMSFKQFMRFIDGYGDEMSVKGCPHWRNAYEVVFIESLVSPYELYRDAPEDKRNQMIKRMTILHKNN